MIQHAEHSKIVVLPLQTLSNAILLEDSMPARLLGQGRNFVP